MADLLPEAWLLEELAVEAQFLWQKWLVTDILVWIQCYSVLESMLSLRYPDKVLKLIAYMATIVRCQKDCDSPSWVLYDRASWKRAEVTKDLNWSAINTSLFNLCFGSRSRQRLICQLCVSKQHLGEKSGCHRAPLPSCSVRGSVAAQQLPLTVVSHPASIAPSTKARTRPHGDLQTVQC